jgi:uncharacterized protein
MIEIKIFDNINLKGYTLIEGFPGAGLVGPMTNSYMIEKLKMQYIGYIISNSFPPIATVHGKMPMFPVRIYKNDKYKLVAIISEFTIPPTIIYELVDEVIEFIRKNGIKQIISVGGMAAQKDDNKVYAITSESNIKRVSDAGISLIDEGVIAGVSGILLIKCLEYNLNVIDILVPVNPTIMDPKYAEDAIIALKKFINMDINTDELEKESKIIQAKVKEALAKTKDSHNIYNNAVDAAGPSMYA